MQPHEPVKGCLIKRNAQGHAVVRLHYTADPEKAQAEWIEKESSKYLGGRNSLQWRREYEIDFKAGSGELVFPEFPELERELILDSVPVADSWTFYGGLDWGIRNPVSFHVYAEAPDKTIYSIWEYYCKGNETNVFEVSRVIRECQYYSRLEWIAYDPQMNKEDQQRKDGLTSIIRMFQEEVPERNKIDILMTAHDRNDMLAVSVVRQLMRDRKLKFWRGCQNQIDEIRNLKYPERKETTNEPEKLLDKNNHTWDDLKYFLLSHPTAKIMEVKPKFGTIGYLNIISDRAREIAAENGQAFQTVFNDLYGKEI